ncbi:hypothetical protein SK128_021505, partial [Halocaridina rubra]
MAAPSSAGFSQRTPHPSSKDDSNNLSVTSLAMSPNLSTWFSPSNISNSYAVHLRPPGRSISSLSPPALPP